MIFFSDFLDNSSTITILCKSKKIAKFTAHDGGRQISTVSQLCYESTSNKLFSSSNFNKEIKVWDGNNKWCCIDTILKEKRPGPLYLC